MLVAMMISHCKGFMRYNTSLSVQHVTVSRGGKSILSDISFDLAPGEVVILRGPNGVGKTTLLKSLAGLISPETGMIHYSEPTVDDVEADLGAACYCGPANAIKTALTVDENLDFWANLYAKEPKKAENAKKTLKLEAYADYPADALSTGYARRLGLARLLIADRPIWLVDEPTASLDKAAATDFEHVVEDHRKVGGAVIIASHDVISLANARMMRLSPGERTL